MKQKTKRKYMQYKTKPKKKDRGLVASNYKQLDINKKNKQ